MSVQKDIENKLEGAFKGLPSLSKSTKESLAGFFQWISLIAGIGQLLVAWGLWQAVRYTNEVVDFVNQYSRAITGKNIGYTSTEKTIMYLGLAVLVVDAVIMLMAYPQLAKRARRGWDLLFLGALINIVYGVLTLFMAGGYGVDNFVWSIIGTGVGLYLLFQVKELYNAKA